MIEAEERRIKDREAAVLHQVEEDKHNGKIESNNKKIKNHEHQNHQNSKERNES